MEGRVPISTSDKMYQRFEEEEIYHIRYFNLLLNNQRYKLTVHPYIININETTIITQVQENIPTIPSYIFHPQHYIQLISLASATNFLPGKKKTLLISHTNIFSIFVTKKKIIPTDVVGRICLIQGGDIYNHNTNTKIIIGLRLDRY